MLMPTERAAPSAWRVYGVAAAIGSAFVLWQVGARVNAVPEPVRPSTAPDPGSMASTVLRPADGGSGQSGAPSTWAPTGGMPVDDVDASLESAAASAAIDAERAGDAAP